MDEICKKPGAITDEMVNRIIFKIDLIVSYVTNKKSIMIL